MVYIVILNWNGWEDTLACLDSIFDLEFEHFKVVVCDNGSKDDSISKIKNWCVERKKKINHFSEVFFLNEPDRYSNIDCHAGAFFLIKSDVNLGYAGGNNLALKFSQFQSDMNYVWVLNNDTVVDKKSLTNLVSHSVKKMNRSIIGSKLVYFSDRDKLQGIGGTYNYWLGFSKHVFGNVSIDKDIKDFEIDYPIGAALFFPRLCLEKVGLLSEDYFLYCEELDYINRAKREQYFADVALDSIVYHKEGASIKKSVLSDFYFIRNKFIISYKYKPLSLFSILFILPFWSLNRARRGEFKKSLNCFKAFYSFLMWVLKKPKAL